MKLCKATIITSVIGMLFGIGMPVFAVDPPSTTLGGEGGVIRKNLDNSTKPVFSDQTLTAPQFIGNVIEVLLGVLGVIFLGLMIYGGYLWMTDMGDEKQIGTAKNIIRNAMIGIVIVVAAYAITAYVIDALLGAAKIG